MPAEPLAASCVALTEHAVDPDLTHTHQADLHARFEQLKTRLPLVARIYAEILASVAASPGPCKAYLSKAGQGVEVAFTQIIQVRQPWERALESLDAFLGAGTAKAASGTGPHKAKRLAWFLDLGTRVVELAEQSARGKDDWTDGRPIAMKRLHERDPRLDYLTEQDRTALALDPQGNVGMVRGRELRLRHAAHHPGPGRAPRGVRRPPPLAAD